MRPNEGEEVSQRNSGPGLDIPTLSICCQNPDPFTSVSGLRGYYAVRPGYPQRAPRAHVFLQETGNTHLQVGIEGLELREFLLGLRVLAESLQWKPTFGGHERLAKT